MSVIDLATYSAKFELDSTGLTKGLEKADKTLKDKMSGISKFLKVSIAGGIAAVTGSLVATTNKAAEATDRIDKMSQKLGMTREGFQEWDFILSQNGASIDSLGAGMKTLTNQVDELAKGGKVATEAFGALGISYQDLAGLSQQEIFEKTIIALQSVEDETKRAALANDLLGRSGQELAPLLNAGADSIAKMKQQAKDLGLVIGDEAIDAGVKFTDTMDQLKRSFGAVFTQIGTSVMPIMQKLAEWVISNMPTIQSIMQSVFSAIGNVVNWVGNIISNYIIPVLNQLRAWIQPNLPAIQTLFQDVFNTIGIVLNTFINIIQSVIQWVQQWVTDNQDRLNAIKESFLTAFQSLQTLITNFITWATEFWNKYGEDIIKILSVVWDNIVDIFQTSIDIITNIFNIFAGIFKGDWEAVWESIKNIFQIVWDFMGRYLERTLEVFKTVISLAWEWISNITSSIWEGIKTFFVNIWNNIVEYITQKVNEQVQFLSNSWNNISQVASNIWNGIKQFFIDVWNGIVNFIADKVNNQIEFLTNSWNNISEIATTVWNNIKQFFQDTWNGIKEIFVNTWDAITEWFNTAMDNLFEWFNGLKDRFLNIGSNLLDWVWDGLKDTWSDIKSWVQDTVSWLKNKLTFWNSSKSKMNKSDIPSIPSIPSYDVGTPFVPSDQLAFIHKGEAVIPAHLNPFNPNNNVKTTTAKTSGDTIFNIDKLEFPNVRDAKDIEKAILDLPRIARMKVKPI